MGIRAGSDLARQNAITKQFTTTGTTAGTGISDDFWPETDARAAHGGEFNAVVYGSFTTATVVGEESYDDGTTWVQSYDIFGAAVSFTAAGVKRLRQHEKGVCYRLRCSVFTTVSTLYGRLSQ